MRPLIIGIEEKAKINGLIRNAEKNIFSMDELLDVKNKEMRPAGELDNFSCTLPHGFRVVYSLEDQPKGLVRHLSVSVDTPGKVPSPEAVQMIMDEFGFEHSLMECVVKMEDIGNGYEAINVLEVINRIKARTMTGAIAENATTERPNPAT